MHDFLSDCLHENFLALIRAKCVKFMGKNVTLFPTGGKKDEVFLNLSLSHSCDENTCLKADAILIAMVQSLKFFQEPLFLRLAGLLLLRD